MGSGLGFGWRPADQACCRVDGHPQRCFDEPVGQRVLVRVFGFHVVQVKLTLGPGLNRNRDDLRGQIDRIDDPDGEGLAELCGEGVAQSGIRVLVTDISSGFPLVVEGVDNITIRSKGKNKPDPINLQFTDVASQSTTICENTVTWHVDQETLPSTQTTGNNPKSSYQVSAREGNLQDMQSFSLGQCDFLEFQLELLDSDAPACLLLPKGAACTTAGECCSGKCKGPSGGKSCK